MMLQSSNQMVSRFNEDFIDWVQENKLEYVTRQSGAESPRLRSLLTENAHPVKRYL